MSADAIEQAVNLPRRAYPMPPGGSLSSWLCFLEAEAAKQLRKVIEAAA
jgi:hypothetical protein